MPTTTVKQTGKTNLTEIAKELGVSLSELKRANPQLERGKNFDLIYPEDVINIPEEAEPITEPTFDPATYAKGKYTKYFKKDGQWYGNVAGNWETFGSKAEAKAANIAEVEPEELTQEEHIAQGDYYDPINREWVSGPTPKEEAEMVTGFDEEQALPVEEVEELKELGLPEEEITPPEELVGELAYDTGNEDFNAFLKVAQDLLQQRLDAGEIVNPNVELSDELIKQFQDQVETELNPYYKSQFQSVRDDLSTDLTFLSEQYSQAVETSQATFKRNLEAQREAEAGRGLIFSGERLTREQQLAQATERSIAGLGTQLGYQAQKIGTGVERTIGSLGLTGLPSPAYTPYEVSTIGAGGYTPLGGRQLFTPTGGITGSMEREQIVAKQLRQSELEEAERKKRVLTFYQ